MSETTTSFLVIHGPNLNLLGKRQPEIYGSTALDEINAAIEDAARDRGFTITSMQSNYEGEILDAIHSHGWSVAGIIINPGAFTHYSYAIRDAIAAVPAPAIEIHLSNTAAREDFRHTSVISPVAVGSIAGLGPSGYLLALHYLMDIVDLEQGSDA